MGDPAEGHPVKKSHFICGHPATQTANLDNSVDGILKTWFRYSGSLEGLSVITEALIAEGK